MITVASAVEKIIRQKPILQLTLYKNLANLSAVAREIQKEVEVETKKEVTEGAILMALKRIKSKLDGKTAKVPVAKPLNMTVRSNLTEYTYFNSETLMECQKELSKAIEREKDIFCNLTRGMTETTIIADTLLEKEIETIFKKETLVSKFTNLSSITIKHPKTIVSIPGVYYTILKVLVWEGINLVEVASTYTELTLVFDEKDINRAFSSLTDFFKSN